MSIFSEHSGGDSAAPSARALGIFEHLRADASAAQLLNLKEDITRHVDEIRRASVQNELLPVDVAEQLATRLTSLLSTLGGLPADHQSAIIGAALYFISNEDEFPDTSSVLGLDDDAAIFNHVAELIGRRDLVIDF